MATRVTFGAVLSTFGDWLLPPPALLPPPPPDCEPAMLNVRDTVGPTLPALSIGRTTTVCAPAARPVNALGLVQAAKAAAVDGALEARDVTVGLENETLAEVPLMSAEPIAALGAALSTV